MISSNLNSSNSNTNSKQNKTILQPLGIVQRRLRIQKIIDDAFWGFLLSSIVVIFFEIVLLSKIFVFLNFFNLGWYLLFFLILFLGICVGMVTGIFLPMDSYESARLTDRYYHFKDRLLTATKLLMSSEPTLMERLQLDDAANYACRVEPKLVIPYRLPKYFLNTISVFSMSMMLGLILPFYFQSRSEVVFVTRLPEIAAVAETLQNELVEEIAELAEKNPETTQLKELSGELQKLVKQLDESSTDTKASLSTLSEMEEAIRMVLNEFRVETFDLSMKDVAEALSVSEATREMSRLLREEKYVQASEEFKRFDMESMATMSKQERKAVGEQMRTTLENMDHRNQKKLHETTEKLTEGFEQNDGEKLREGTDEFSAECNRQALRKEISNSLEGKLTLLGLCKSESNGSGGLSNNSNSGGDNTNKSELADKNWGTGAAGNPTSGEASQLDSQREQQKITGTLGQGESEYEKFHSGEAPQEKIVREQRESSFQEYHKMAETVLESEPIPLGQRQMIRRYFELIRAE
ncbi:MAG: hypothetical protein LBC20_12540 [Planctomycetaceae bacterium]|jgi:hypothetical protein|nr:hypothetical protein [Planctomycetaceae bacterium]